MSTSTDTALNLPARSPASSDAGVTMPHAPSPWPRWLRAAVTEPLLHFLLLGGLVFGADHVLTALRGDPQTIVIGATVRQEAHDLFAAGMKREPNAAELQQMLDRWVDNEVLYREGLALGLDRGDTSIRERVIFKALSVTQAALVLPKPEASVLRQWFDAHHARYDTPTRIDFLEAVVAGASTPEALKAFADLLNAKGQGETESSLRVFKDRPRGNLVQSYGEAFTAALEKATPEQWQVLASNAGPRLVRLDGVKPGVLARYDELRDTVLQDWRDDTQSQLTSQAVHEMARKYRVQGGGAGS